MGGRRWGTRKGSGFPVEWRGWLGWEREYVEFCFELRSLLGFWGSMRGVRLGELGFLVGGLFLSSLREFGGGRFCCRLGFFGWLGGEREGGFLFAGGGCLGWVVWGVGLWFGDLCLFFGGSGGGRFFKFFRGRTSP